MLIKNSRKRQEDHYAFWFNPMVLNYDFYKDGAKIDKNAIFNRYYVEPTGRGMMFVNAELDMIVGHVHPDFSYSPRTLEWTDRFGAKHVADPAHNGQQAEDEKLRELIRNKCSAELFKCGISARKNNKLEGLTYDKLMEILQGVVHKLLVRFPEMYQQI